MRGHEPLLAMRRRGLCPVRVHLDIAARRPIDWHVWRESQAEADVVVDPTETPELLDLRFVVGLLVFVTGAEPARVKRLVLAAESAGADRVFGFAHRQVGPDRFESLGDFCTVGGQAWRA
jgi:hypothetical protein